MQVLKMEVGGSLLLVGMREVEIRATIIGNLQRLLVRVKVPPGTKKPM